MLFEGGVEPRYASNFGFSSNNSTMFRDSAMFADVYMECAEEARPPTLYNSNPRSGPPRN